jgi:hypothetical protein
MKPHQFERGFAEAIALVETRLGLLFSDKAKFENIVRSGLALQQARDIEQKVVALCRAGMFSEELLRALLEQPYSLNAASFIWDCFVTHKLVTRLFSFRPEFVADHQLHNARIERHLRNDTFLNLFAPPAALVTRYSGALVAIDVTKVCGQTARGSGFLVWFQGFAWVVTCKHNVNPEDGIVEVKISDSKGLRISVEKPKLSSSYDLAIYRLPGTEGLYFRFSDECAIFDEVYTLGYPYVPGAHPMVVGHRGELNGLADLYVEKMPALLISNLVSPGGSGCPVLIRDGHCVGMTVRWLEGEWDAEKARFSAALPATKIAEFILENL